jgi:hypothetical protein
VNRCSSQKKEIHRSPAHLPLLELLRARLHAQMSFILIIFADYEQLESLTVIMQQPMGKYIGIERTEGLAGHTRSSSAETKLPAGEGKVSPINVSQENCA